MHQIAGLCLICSRNVDLAKRKKKKVWLRQGGKNPCVGKKTNCRQGGWRLCSESALSSGLQEQQRQKVGLLTPGSGRYRETDVETEVGASDLAFCLCESSSTLPLFPFHVSLIPLPPSLPSSLTPSKD